MSKKVITCNTAPSAIGTYSQAITVDKFTFISGQIPLDYKNMSIIEGTFEDQVAVVLNNLKNIAMWAIIVFLTIGLYNMFKSPQSNARGGDDQVIFSEFLSFNLIAKAFTLVFEFIFSNFF